MLNRIREWVKRREPQHFVTPMARCYGRSALHAQQIERWSGSDYAGVGMLAVFALGVGVGLVLGICLEDIPLWREIVSR